MYLDLSHEVGEHREGLLELLDVLGGVGAQLHAKGLIADHLLAHRSEHGFLDELGVIAVHQANTSNVTEAQLRIDVCDEN